MRVSRKWAAASMAALTMTCTGFFAGAASADESAEPAPETAVVVNEVGPQATYPGFVLGWSGVFEKASYEGAYAAAGMNGPFTAWDGGGAARTKHNSAGANGNLCKYTRFWNSEGTKYFFLRSESWDGTEQTRDPNLANGVGTGTWSKENWQNRVRTLEFHTGSRCV